MAQHFPDSLSGHRVRGAQDSSVVDGEVRYAPLKSLWFMGMAGAAVVGGVFTFSWAAVSVFVVATGLALLFGHSLGSHRKLIHNSFQCPLWLEYLLVWLGVQVGLAGPLGLLRQHELRDYAQRLSDCHDYLRHGRSFWRDAWWQLHCELHLVHPPRLVLEPRIAGDQFYRWLERTWMAQQLPPALVLYALGGWAFVFWGVCARVTAGVLGHWLIGWFAHNRGGMHYEVRGAAVQGRNIRFTSLLTMGECWHNNHHAFPGSARLGLFAGEWDPGWWVLMVLRKFGLAWNFRLPAALPPRAELQACDAPGRWALAHPAAPNVPPPVLRDVWHLCWNRAWPCALRGPAAHLSSVALLRLIGGGVAFEHRPEARRMTAVIQGHELRGLPALCVAVGRNGGLAWLLALCLVPLAVVAEGLRGALDAQ